MSLSALIYVVSFVLYTFNKLTITGVKMMPISLLIREKNQRLEAVRAVDCIHQSVFPAPNDSNRQPVTR